MPPRIRSIKPEFWDDELVGSMTPLHRLTFIGLFSHADDEGRMRGSAAFVRSQVFAYDDSVSTDDVEGVLRDLHIACRILLYGTIQRYLQVVNFGRHQRIDKPRPSSLPAPGRHHPSHILKPVPEQGIRGTIDDASARPPIRIGIGIGSGMDETSLSTSAEPKRDVRAEAREVFQHWVKVWEKRKNTKFDGKRLTNTEARLRSGYTVAELCESVSGYRKSAHHMGANPEGKKWDDLELFMRSSSHVDAGIAHGESKPQPVGAAVAEPSFYQGDLANYQGERA